MSVCYVISGVSKEALLKHIKNIPEITVNDHPYAGDYKVLTMEIGPDYSLRKRVALGNFMAKISDGNITPDSLPEGTATASVFISMDIADKDNTWFEGFGVSTHHPETILAAIVEHLKSIGIESRWATEHEDLYRELAGDIP